jgi:UBA/TS-N domain
MSLSSAIVNLCDDEAEDAAALAQVMELGISRDTALAALQLSQGNVERAIEHVFAEPAAAAASSSAQAPPEALRQCRSCETYASADSMQILEACNHMLCRQCLRPLQQQQPQQLKHPVCPARSCGRPLAIRDLALLLPPRALETLQSSALASFKHRLTGSFPCKQCSTVLQPGSTSSNSKGKRSASAAAASNSSARTVAELQVKHMLTCRCGATACCACRESIAAAATQSTHSCTYSNLAVLLQLLTELELLVPDPDSTASAATRRAAGSSAAAAAAAATKSKAPAAKRAKPAVPKPADTWAWGNPFSTFSGSLTSSYTGAIYDDDGELTYLLLLVLIPALLG